MKVYVVSHGERSEGGNVVSIHKSIESATKAALSFECHFSGGWTPDSDGSTYWTNGCDFVCVESFKVKP